MLNKLPISDVSINNALVNQIELKVHQIESIWVFPEWPSSSKYDYIIECIKTQLGWLNLPHLPILLLPVTVNSQ